VAEIWFGFSCFGHGLSIGCKFASGHHVLRVNKFAMMAGVELAELLFYFRTNIAASFHCLQIVSVLSFGETHSVLAKLVKASKLNINGDTF